MMMFLVLKERLRSFYGKYAAAADGMVKFIYSFAALWMMSHNLGFMTRLNSMAVVLLLSPVSYTHLDVYKRQSWWRAVSRVSRRWQPVSRKGLTAGLIFLPAGLIWTAFPTTSGES